MTQSVHSCNIRVYSHSTKLWFLGVDMEKLILVKLEIDALHSNHTWYATTENGTVPERFYAFPNSNGDYGLIKVTPVINIEGIETWTEDNSLEEVEVDLLEDFAEKYIPRYKDCRWFAEKKVAVAPRQSRGSN